MTLHFNYIIQAVRYGLVKVSYIIQFDVPPHALDFTQKIIFGPRTFVALSSCRARYFLLYLNLVWCKIFQPAWLAVLCSSRVKFGGGAVTSGEAVGNTNRLVPTPIFGTRLRRQNFNLAPTQYRQLRRLLGSLLI